MDTTPWLRPRGDAAPVLALGCMNFGARTADADALRIIDRAVDAGVRLLDTANMYANGRSEQLVGQAIAGRRDQVLVASKVGLGRNGRHAEGLAHDTILAACDASLARLGTDWIDLYYLHAPDPRTPVEDSLAAVGKLLAAGKIRHWGLSNHASWQILELRHLAQDAGLPPPAVAQQLYNALVRQLDVEYFRFARRYGVHTTVYNPLAGGVLTGQHHFDASPPAGSRFHGNKRYQRRYWTRALFDAVEALRAIAADEGLDLVTLAYAFLLGHPDVDSVLVGPGTLDHLDAALAARDATLSPAARRRVLAVGAELVGTDARYAR